MKAAHPRPGSSTKDVYLSAMIVGALLLGTLRVADAENMIAEYYDMSDGKFSVRVISPDDRVREYAICKAAWFAEKRQAERMSLSDPVYDEPPAEKGPFPIETPAEWIMLNTTVYLDDETNPSGNPSVSVPEYAAVCRQGWDWYR